MVSFASPRFVFRINHTIYDEMNSFVLFCFTLLPYKFVMSRCRAIKLELRVVCIEEIKNSLIACILILRFVFLLFLSSYLMTFQSLAW